MWTSSASTTSSTASSLRAGIGGGGGGAWLPAWLQNSAYVTAQCTCWHHKSDTRELIEKQPGNVGADVGNSVGAEVGNSVGSAVGSALGSAVGSALGSAEGSAVGSAEGSAVGSGVGGCTARWQKCEYTGLQSTPMHHSSVATGLMEKQSLHNHHRMRMR
jgi:hypothetical protein